MRRLILGVVVMCTLGSSPAAASEVGAGRNHDTIIVTDERPGDEVRAEPVADVADRWYRYDVLLWHAESGQFCVEPRWTRNQAYAERQGRLDFPARFDPITGRPRANCPANAVAVPAPAEIAADIWLHVEDLPVPTLAVRPTYAIAGKQVYLEIAGAHQWSRTIDNPIGDNVTISATSTYLIDWNDPTDSAPTRTTSQGGPYPGGDVTHVYTQRSTRTDIVVTQQWRATWRAGSRSGTLAALQTQSAPLAIDVREIQAVRNR